MRVHTWCPSTGAWPQAQNSIAVRHWYSGIPKYHLMPKFETFSSGTDTVPECWYEYLKNTCVFISALRQSWLGTKCEHSQIIYQTIASSHLLWITADCEITYGPCCLFLCQKFALKKTTYITLGRASAIESVVSV